LDQPQPVRRPRHAARPAVAPGHPANSRAASLGDAGPGCAGDLDNPRLADTHLSPDGPGSIPWPVPHHAAGGIWRARRAIVVGDPFQVEPIVTLDRNPDARLAERRGVLAPIEAVPLDEAGQRLGLAEQRAAPAAQGASGETGGQRWCGAGQARLKRPEHRSRRNGLDGLRMRSGNTDSRNGRLCWVRP